MKREVDEALAGLSSDDPVPVATRQVFNLFQQWYFTFAKRNAGRLALINANVRRQIQVTTVALMLIALILAVVGYVSIRVTIDQSNDRHKFAESIQASRFDASYNSCHLSNMRHDKAVAYVQTILVDQLGKHPTPAAKAAGEKGAREFDTLINDLTPKRKNCQAFASKQVGLP